MAEPFFQQPVPQYPFLQPGVYSPGQMAFNNNPEMSQLISMFAGPLLGQMAGPGNFVPHMMPSQNLMDQYAMRQYQQQTIAARQSIKRDPNENVANLLLGARSAITDAPASDLNREQATQMAQMANHPIAQMVLGSMVGPENLEMIMHGSKGNVQALNQAVNRIGYFRRDPQGGSRMDGDSLANFTRGMYSEMYEPSGDIDELAERARADDARSVKQLREAARITNRELVSDTDIATRIGEKRPEEVEQLYKKYVAGGTATDTAVQAQELTKFRRAIADSGVLKENETSVAALSDAAKRMGSADMFGLTAGQAGQLTEHLFQRGMLPQSLGNMSAADRVRMIQSTTAQMGEGQLDRMARDFGHQTLMKDATEAGGKYRNMTEVQQREEVEKRLPEFRQQLDDTREKLKKFAEGDTSIGPEELEQLGGMDLMGSNVDASRAADTVKKYAGAVDAVREIFGDNGNPNAPMPALLAALNHLTQGSMGNMKPQQVQATLRQMQQVARETGIGFQQMAAISASMGAQGDMLGVHKQVTMQNMVGNMASVKAMQDTGMFSGVTTFGAMNRDQALEREGRLLQAGAASANSLSMAALASIYEADSGRFAGTELEAAMAAYNDPNSDGTYEYDGQKKNLYEMIGEGGPLAAMSLGERVGIESSEFNASYYDPASKDNVRADFGRRTQRYEARRDLNAFVGQGFAQREGIDGTSLSMLSEDEQRKMSAAIGETFTQMVIDTSTLGRVGQLDEIQKNLEGKLVETFREQGHPNPEAAAAEVAQQMTGDRSKLNQAVSSMGMVYHSQTGEALVREGQSSSSTVDAAAQAEMRRVAATQQQRDKMNLGQFKAGPMARVADYLAEIGKSGEKFNVENLMKHVAQVMPEGDLRDTFQEEMAPMFREIAEMQSQAYVTKDEIEGLSVQAERGDTPDKRQAAMAELRKHAGLKDTDRVLTDEKEIAAERQKAADAIGEPRLKQMYEGLFGSGAAKGLTVDQMRDKLSEGGGYNVYNNAVERQLNDGGTYTFDGLVRRAEGSIGAEKDAKLARVINQGLRAADNGEDVDQSRVFLNAIMDQVGVTDADARKKISDLTLSDLSKTGGQELESAISGLGLNAEDAERLQAIAGGLRQGQLTPLSRAGIEQAANANITKPDEATRQQSDAEEDRRKVAAAREQAEQDKKKADAATGAKQEEKGWAETLTDAVKSAFGYGEQQSPTVRTDSDAKQKTDKVAVDTNTATVTADKIEVHGDITVDGKTTEATPTGAAPAATSAPAAQPAATEPATPAAPATPDATQAAALAAQPAATEPATPPLRQDKQLSPTVADKNQPTVYDLTGKDLIEGFGGEEAIRGDTNKQQEALQASGLLSSLRGIKTAQEKGSASLENVELEKFSVKMRDAVQSGLLPHPVDEDGDKIYDFEGDEAIAAAEKYLSQYLPKSPASPAQAAKQTGQTEPDATQADAGPQQPVPEPQQDKPLPQYDYSPKDFKASASQKGEKLPDGRTLHSYKSIDEPGLATHFTDRDGNPVERPTTDAYFDAAHAVDIPATGDQPGQEQIIAQIGDKYYEQHTDYERGVTTYREVSVGEGDKEPSAVTPDAQQAQQPQQTAQTQQSAQSQQPPPGPKQDKPLPPTGGTKVPTTDELLAQVDAERAAILEEARKSGGDDAVQLLEDEAAYAGVEDKVKKEERQSNEASDATRAEREQARDRLAYNRYAKKNNLPLAGSDEDVKVDVHMPGWDEESKLRVDEKYGQQKFSPEAVRLKELEKSRQTILARQEKEKGKAKPADTAAPASAGGPQTKPVDPTQKDEKTDLKKTNDETLVKTVAPDEKIPDAGTVAGANDKQYLKSVGLSSANIPPQIDIRSQAADFSAPAVPDAMPPAPRGGAPLNTSLPEPQYAGGSDSAGGDARIVPVSAQTANAAQQNSPGGATPANTGNQSMNITGTLSLNGLREAILSASGGQPMQTPGDGPPVVQNPPNFA